MGRVGQGRLGRGAIRDFYMLNGWMGGVGIGAGGLQELGLVGLSP